MEIAVTLPDEIAERADALAARWGVSRSKLIEDAIRLYLDVRESQTAHGALGVTDDTPLAWWYAHERAARIYDGPDEVHKTVVARKILRRYGLDLRSAGRE